MARNSYAGGSRRSPRSPSFPCGRCEKRESRRFPLARMARPDAAGAAADQCLLMPAQLPRPSFQRRTKRSWPAAARPPPPPKKKDPLKACILIVGRHPDGLLECRISLATSGQHHICHEQWRREWLLRPKPRHAHPRGGGYHGFPSRGLSSCRRALMMPPARPRNSRGSPRCAIMSPVFHPPSCASASAPPT